MRELLLSAQLLEMHAKLNITRLVQLQEDLLWIRTAEAKWAEEGCPLCRPGIRCEYHKDILSRLSRWIDD